MYRFQSFVLIVLFLLLAQPNFASACSCAPKAEIADAYKTASAIFVGRVKKIGTNPLRKSKKEISFELIRKIKGLDDFQGNKVIVYTAENGAMCGYDFSPNIEYLVYAKGSPARLSVNLCSRTNFFDLARDEVKELSKLAEKEEAS